MESDAALLHADVANDAPKPAIASHANTVISNAELSDSAAAPTVSSHGYGYGVRHFISPREGLLVDVVSDVLELSLERVNELLWLGAIYREQERCHSDVTAIGAVENSGDAIRAKALETSTTRVNHGDLLRVHTTPRRYDVGRLSSSKMIIFENDDFIVIDKPAGLPVHATVDNARENILTVLSVQMGVDLKITHRLDIATSGLMLYAKNLNFQKTFNGLLSDALVKKVYRATVNGDFVKSGYGAGDRLVHYMEPSPRAPKKLSLVEKTDWLKCVLKIVGISPANNVEKSSQFKTDAAALNTHVDIELETGRTHQIRAQLSFIGHPILGDARYGCATINSRNDSEKIALRCHKLEFLGKYNFSLPT